MAHAGAANEGDAGTADSKITAMSAAGIKMADLPTDIPSLLK